MSDIGERDDTDNQTVLAVERNATALVSTTADRYEEVPTRVDDQAK